MLEIINNLEMIDPTPAGDYRGGDGGCGAGGDGGGGGGAWRVGEGQVRESGGSLEMAGARRGGGGGEAGAGAAPAALCECGPNGGGLGGREREGQLWEESARLQYKGGMDRCRTTGPAPQQSKRTHQRQLQLAEESARLRCVTSAWLAQLATAGATVSSARPEVSRLWLRQLRVTC